MAVIREVLSLEDQFSSVFSKYINMAQQASFSTGSVTKATATATAATQQQAAQTSSASATMQAAYSSATQEVYEMVVQIRQAAEAIRAQASQTQAAASTMSTALSSAASDAQELASRTNSAVDALKEQAEQAEKNATSLDKMAKKSDTASDAAKKLVNTLKAVATAKIVTETLSLADSLTNTNARLSMIADPGETAEDLQAKIMASANRSRANYLSTSSAIGQMGIMAGDAFNNNDELIAFMEAINKQFVIAGTSAAGIDSAMLQLTQAMSSGVLRGEELNSVFEQAPNIIQTIADYLNVPIGQIRDMASEGQITADVVKNAMLSATDDINEQFEQMPRTWEQLWNQLQNIALQASQPILNAVSWVADNIDIAIKWISDNMENILPILMGVAAAAAVVGASMVASGLATAAAWAAANWPILLVAASVAALIYMARAAGATWEEIGGTIGGVFMFLYAAAMNTLIVPLQNQLANFANFFGNFLNDPIASISILFYDMATTLLGYISSVAHGLENLVNSIPGVEISITGAIDTLYNGVKSAADTLKNQTGWTEYVTPWDYVDVKGAWDTGYAAGASVGSQIDNFNLEDFMSNALGGGYSGSLDISNISSGVGDITDALDGIGSDVSSIKKDVSLAEEDVKMLVDMAERQYVIKINNETNAPNVSVNVTNSGSKSLSGQEIAREIGKILMTQSASNTEKTYTVALGGA